MDVVILLSVLILLAAAAGAWFLRRMRNDRGRLETGEAAVAVFVPQGSPRIEAVDLSDLVERLREPLRRWLPGIAVRVQTRPRLPAARADRAHVELIVAHLAAAAREAMPDGGTLTVRTYAQSTDDEGPGGEGVVLEVEHGGESHPSQLPRLFEPLSAGDAAGGMLRLGLATVQMLTYHSHGTMRVETRAGGGARIGVLLPRMHSPIGDPRSLGARGRETVLVVEDEDSVRDVVRRTLESAGYTVLQAADPLTALDILARRREEVDLLLSDIFMHHMRGTELVRRVREHWPLVRILYMTGYGDDPSIAQEVARDAALLLSKPFSGEELLAAVRSALDALPGPSDAPLAPGQ